MVEKIKQTKSEKILLVFILILGIVAFGSLIIIKNKGLYKLSKN